MEIIDTVLTEVTSDFFSYLNINNEVSTGAKNFILFTFQEYILLTAVSEYKQLHLNDLFESTFVDKSSKSVNRIKKDLTKIKNLLNEAHELIHTTKAGEILIRNKNKRVRNSIDFLSSLANLAEHENTLLEFQKGRNKSQERIARLEMLSKLMFIAEYYGVHSKTTQTGDFYNIVETIYNKLGIIMNNLNSDMNEARYKHNLEKAMNELNFKFMFEKV